MSGDVVRHTPGPWVARHTRVEGRNGHRWSVVATIPNSSSAAIPVEQRLANAALIAAAPKLKELAEEICQANRLDPSLYAEERSDRLSAMAALAAELLEQIEVL